MKKPSKKDTSALVLLQDRQISASVELTKLQAAALHQLDTLARLNREAPVRAILVGLTLHKIKAVLKRGEFIPWIKQHVKGRGYVQCTYYMRLAVAFAEKTRVTKPEILAIAGDQTELAIEPADDTARRMMEKITKFVGESNLSELLDRYRIKETKKLGGAREGNDSEDVPEETDPEELYEQARDAIGAVLTSAEELLIRDNRLQHLAGHPEEIRGVVESLRRLAERVEAAAQLQLNPETEKSS